jgi:predicted  nucleic acid-binding Zn-ribbon protein
MITKDEFIANLKTQLDEMSSEIDEMEKKALEIKEKSRAGIQKQITKLRAKRDAALNKLQEIKNTNEDAWVDLKKGVENVVNSLKTGLTKTLSHYK